MAVQIQGNGGTVLEVDGTNFRPGRVTPMPADHQSNGHFRLARIVSLVASQAANGTLFSFRWAPAGGTKVALIQRIAIAVQQTGAHTGAIHPRFQVFVARSWSAADTGGTLLTTTGNNAKRRTSHATTLVDARVSASSAGVTAGTRTLDADPILDMSTHMVATVPTASAVLPYQRAVEFEGEGGMHQLLLANQEGFIVRGPTTAFGAAGTADLVVEVAWVEKDSY